VFSAIKLKREHFFCECTIAVFAWSELRRITGLQKDIKQFCDISSLWNYKKERKIINMVHAALLRAIWLMRNV
jgi:hypothetical protein